MFMLAIMLLAGCWEGNQDQDQDGFEAEAAGGLDCNDNAANINPAAPEIWYNGVDEDCSGGSDYDADGDGVETLGRTEDGDCDDGDPDIFPGAADLAGDGVDTNCDGIDGEDGDGDGVASLSSGGADCDDDDASSFPDAADLAGDGVDTNCDGIDGEDGDGDGVASLSSGGADCDDTNSTVSPGASDPVGDGVDADCDGIDGEDGDGDGVASLSSGGADCDDTDSTVSPEAEEVCTDGVDNDCDGSPGHCVLSSEVSLRDADLSMRAFSLDGEVGHSVSSGDFNSDGFTDVLIGGPGSDLLNTTESGNVYVVLGPVSKNNDLEFDLKYADKVIDGDSSGDRFGDAVLSAGDVNGDGHEDVLIGAPLVARSASSTNYEGAAYLFYGPMTGPTLAAADADAVRFGPEASSSRRIGGALSRAGDVNGDGFEDLWIGHDRLNPNTAWLLLGPLSGQATVGDGDDVTIDGPTGSLMGGALDGTGDFDGDGVQDTLIGATYYNTWRDGDAYLLLGPVTADLTLQAAGSTQPDGVLVFEGESGDYAGYVVASAGDVDSDGFDDALIGAPQHRQAGTGRAYLMLGGSSMSSRSLSSADAIFEGEALSDMAGSSVDAAGDIDADGADDLLIGACQGYYTTCEHGSGAGLTYLIYGGSLGGTHSLADADVRFVGGAVGSGAGHVALGAGDVSGDGLPDILISAPFEEQTHFEGVVYLIANPGGW